VQAKNDLQVLLIFLLNKLLNKISSILNCCNALGTLLFDADTKCLLKSHHNLNLQEVASDYKSPYAKNNYLNTKMILSGYFLTKEISNTE